MYDGEYCKVIDPNSCVHIFYHTLNSQNYILYWAVRLGDGTCYLPGPGRPATFAYSRTRAYCACSRCWTDWLYVFIFSSIFHFECPVFWETADVAEIL